MTGRRNRAVRVVLAVVALPLMAVAVVLVSALAAVLVVVVGFGVLMVLLTATGHAPESWTWGRDVGATAFQVASLLALGAWIARRWWRRRHAPRPVSRPGPYAATRRDSTLPREEAVALLVASTGRRDRGGAGRLAAAVDDHPAALIVVAAEMWERRCSYDEVVAAISGAETVSAGAEEGPWPAGATRAVLRALQGAEDRDASGAVRVVLETVAMLEPEGVGIDLLEVLATRAGVPDDAARAPARVEAARHRLATTPLLGWSGDDEDLALFAPPLVARVVRARAARDGHLADGLLDVLAALSLTLETTPDDELDAVARHARALWHHVEREHRRVPAAPFPALAAQLVVDVADRLVSVGPDDSAERADRLKQAVELGEELGPGLAELLGDDHPNTLALIADVAKAHAALGRAVDPGT